MKNFKKHFIIFLTLTALLYFTPGISNAKTYSDESTGAKVGLVTASILTSLLYTPTKFVYAVGGTVVSGLTMAFTAGQGGETAGTIAKKSVTGDWYVHPNVFLGSEELNFNGPDDK